MKKVIRIFSLTIVILLLIPITYSIISLGLTYNIISPKEVLNKEKVIYLNSNGIHLDIIIPTESIECYLTKNLSITSKEQYISFGWGDKNFYLNTKTWNDLKFSNVCTALFLKSETLMHVTKHSATDPNWVIVPLSEKQLKLLNTYIYNSFNVNVTGKKTILPTSYGLHDNFYLANGSYSCLKTCNTWVNNAFRYAGLKSCLWTPYDFGVLSLYK